MDQHGDPLRPQHRQIPQKKAAGFFMGQRTSRFSCMPSQPGKLWARPACGGGRLRRSSKRSSGRLRQRMSLRSSFHGRLWSPVSRTVRAGSTRHLHAPPSLSGHDAQLAAGVVQLIRRKAELIHHFRHDMLHAIRSPTSETGRAPPGDSWVKYQIGRTGRVWRPHPVTKDAKLMVRWGAAGISAAASYLPSA